MGIKKKLQACQTLKKKQIISLKDTRYSDELRGLPSNTMTKNEK